MSGYSARRLSFILAHREAYDAAYLNPSHAAASNELARLSREYKVLPPRHDCSCKCPYERRGYQACSECKRLREKQGCLMHANGYVPGCEACNEHQEPHPDIGRTSSVNAPMPSAMMLDLERALTVLGIDSEAHQLARYMSLNGTSRAADLDDDERQDMLTVPAVPVRAQLRRPTVAAEREVSCLMCSRAATASERQCRYCGGCLVLLTVA